LSRKSNKRKVFFKIVGKVQVKIAETLISNDADKESLIPSAKNDASCSSGGLCIQASIDFVERALVNLGATIEKNIYGKNLEGSGILVIQF
jgi:hypothetical protein